MDQQDDWNLDLSAPIRHKQMKPPKKDHKCPHDRKHPTGMEVCEACGDYGTCATCGAGYIRRDVYRYHLTLCWPCAEIAILEDRLEQLKRERERERSKR